jgi:hypothetical protein
VHTASPFHLKADDPQGMSPDRIIRAEQLANMRHRNHRTRRERHNRYSRKRSQIRVSHHHHLKLTACHTHSTGSPTVKRVVITSSTAAFVLLPPPYDPPRSTTFSEKDWNMESIRIVEEKGRDAPNTHKYRASKTLAERGACWVVLAACCLC